MRVRLVFLGRSDGSSHMLGFWKKFGCEQDMAKFIAQVFESTKYTIVEVTCPSLW